MFDFAGPNQGINGSESTSRVIPASKHATDLPNIGIASVRALPALTLLATDATMSAGAGDV
jgi:hypothetical protein